MPIPAPKFLWLAIGLAGAALATASLVLTPWLDLHPCHLCIFQRLLFMLIALLGITAAFSGRQRLAGGPIVPLALMGAGTAGYQSWLQAHPADTLSCVGGDPSLIERVVEWLGQQVPALFLATGYCEDEELVILGLSLANWALLAFLTCAMVAAYAFTRGEQR